MTIVRFALVLHLVCASAFVSGAGAQPAPSDDRDLAQRVAFLDTALKKQQPSSRAYFGAWVSIMGALAAGQAVQAVLADDRGTRASYITGSTFSAVGLALVLAAPSPGRWGYAEFASLPDESLEERRHKVRRGETLLLGEVNAFRRTRAWYTHAIGAALGLGGFLGLHFGYEDNLLNALRTGVGTFVITELRIWSRPRRAPRALDTYRASFAGDVLARVVLTPMVATGTFGAFAGGRF